MDRRHSDDKKIEKVIVENVSDRGGSLEPRSSSLARLSLFSQSFKANSRLFGNQRSKQSAIPTDGFGSPVWIGIYPHYHAFWPCQITVPPSDGFTNATHLKIQTTAKHFRV